MQGQVILKIEIGLVSYNTSYNKKLINVSICL